MDATEQCVEAGRAVRSLPDLLIKLHIKNNRKSSNQVESKNLGYVMNC